MVVGMFDIIHYEDSVWWLKQGTRIFKVFDSVNLNWLQKIVQRVLCCFGRHKFIRSGHDENMCFLYGYNRRVFGGWCDCCKTAVRFKIRDICISIDFKELAKRAKALLWHRKFYGCDATINQGTV